MGYEAKDGFGNLFSNDKKGNEKAPDYRGEIMLGGNIWEIAGWMKAGKNGPFLSLSGKVKAPPNQQAGAPQVAKAEFKAPVIDPKDPFSGFDDDVPFAPHGKDGAGVSWRAM